MQESRQDVVIIWLEVDLIWKCRNKLTLCNIIRQGLNFDLGLKPGLA